MSAPTHRVVGGAVHRRDETLEPGDTCTPTEDELRAFPDRFEQMDTRPVEDTTDDLSLGDAQAILEDAGIDYEDYRSLQSAASDYDGVVANVPKSELQVDLAAAIRDAE